MKYSSAMLRPPETEKRLSATNSLLCIRWLMRLKSCSDQNEAAGERAAARRQRIEQAHLDVRQGREGAEQLVLAGGVEIVDEQAHANAASGGIGERAQEAQADAVLLQLVVLDVERALGATRQRQARIEGEVAGRQEAKARFARAGAGEARRRELAEGRVAGVGQGRARRSRRWRRQARAAGKRDAETRTAETKRSERDRGSGMDVAADPPRPAIIAAR